MHLLVTRALPVVLAVQALFVSTVSAQTLRIFNIDPYEDVRGRYPHSIKIKKHREIPIRPWYFDALNIEGAWKYSKGSSQGLIAMVDSGIDYEQEFFNGGIWRNLKEKTGNNRDNDGNGYKNDIKGWNFVKQNNNPMDMSAHGTWLSSFMIARPGKDHPTGLCPGCTIMPLRIFNADGTGGANADERLIEAIDYAVANGAKIINLATAGEGEDEDLEAAIRDAGKKDVLVLAAASNDEENLDQVDTYPAKYKFPHMATVAATSPNGDFSARSNWGHKSVHFGAPGDRMVGYWILAEDGDDAGWFDDGEGTSDAVAVASAVAGLIRSAYPELKATEVRDILMKTVTPSRYLKNKTITGGIINAEAALRCAADRRLSCLL